MKSVCLAILNYNGARHLAELLPTALDAARGRPVVVLDNCSTEDDIRWIRKHFPAVETAVAPANDFLFSYNWLLSCRNEDVVVLLNNDVRLERDFLPPLLRHLEARDVFAACSTSRDWDDAEFTCGPARLRSHHGLYYWSYDTDRQELEHTLFASAGFAAVDRRKFVELGGFNPLFRPAYCEDFDLCFRAWRRGWRCVFEPASVVYHRENGSWGNARSTRLIERSRMLFQWSTLPATGAWLERTAMLVRTALRRPEWGLNLVRTWREWRRLRSGYAWMKTPRTELNDILRRIEEPVPLP